MISSPRTPPIPDTDSDPIRLAVCVSGGGTTLANLIRRIEANALRARIVHVIASKPGLRAIEIAESASIPVDVIERKGKTLDEFSDQIFKAIRGAGADLVILGGFLALIRIPSDYENRVMNIHPSLIPAFCGKGLHGEAVHQAALARGVKVSGCTVHYADNEYDAGPIILQRVVPVLDDDTPQTLAARVFEAECEALPDAIAQHAAGRTRIAADGKV